MYFKHKNLSVTAQQTSTVKLENFFDTKSSRSIVRGSPRVQESITTLLCCLPISVLLSTVLTRIDLDRCSLDRRPFRDLLCK